jgi:peroxiredoxin
VIPPAVVDLPPASSTLPIGAEAPSFTGLLGVDGRRYGFGDFADRGVLVLIFSSNRCPTAKAYESRMMALQSEYEPLGLQLIAINSNDPHLYPDESYERMIDRAADGGYTVPYLWDEGQAVARLYGPTKTFHVFVLDGSRRLRYEGRFDDSRIPERVTSHDLRNALDDVIAGREVSEPVTRAFGCSLDIVA